jgi:hypothetical protein
MSRSRDLLVLLGYGLAIGGCGAAVDDPNGGSASASGGDGRDELNQAIEACGPWAQRYVACYAELYGSEYEVSYLSFMGYCISYFGYASIQGPGCADALGDYYACLAKIDCDVLSGDGDEDGDALCEDEAIAQEEACDLFGDSDGDEDVPLTDAGEQSSADEGDSTTTGGEPGGSSSETTTTGGESSSTG